MLTGKQKRYLRSLAVNEKALVQIGKDGITDNLVMSIREALKSHELVKIAIHKGCELSINELVIDILANTQSDLVQTIGKTIVIYKPAKERKIILP